jgi:hypothetical protein
MQTNLVIKNQDGPLNYYLFKLGSTPTYVMEQQTTIHNNVGPLLKWNTKP